MKELRLKMQKSNLLTFHRDLLLEKLDDRLLSGDPSDVAGFVSPLSATFSWPVGLCPATGSIACRSTGRGF